MNENHILNDFLTFRLDINQRLCSLLKAENEHLKCGLENAFDAGYDAGFFRGFENANKVNSKQITKPKAMTFKQFLEQKFGIE